jgi:hypothetical protein
MIKWKQYRYIKSRGHDYAFYIGPLILVQVMLKLDKYAACTFLGFCNYDIHSPLDTCFGVKS